MKRQGFLVSGLINILLFFVIVILLIIATISWSISLFVAIKWLLYRSESPVPPVPILVLIKQLGEGGPDELGVCALLNVPIFFFVVLIAMFTIAYKEFSDEKHMLVFIINDKERMFNKFGNILARILLTLGAIIMAAYLGLLVHNYLFFIEIWLIRRLIPSFTTPIWVHIKMALRLEYVPPEIMMIIGLTLFCSTIIMVLCMLIYVRRKINKNK